MWLNSFLVVSYETTELWRCVYFMYLMFCTLSWCLHALTPLTIVYLWCGFVSMSTHTSCPHTQVAHIKVVWILIPYEAILWLVEDAFLHQCCAKGREVECADHHIWVKHLDGSDEGSSDDWLPAWFRQQGCHTHTEFHAFDILQPILGQCVQDITNSSIGTNCTLVHVHTTLNIHEFA